MQLHRRQLLKLSGAAGLAGGLADRAAAQGATGGAPDAKADHVIRIGTGLIEVAPDNIVSASVYNGQFPGPLLRFKEGQRTVVDIFNDTDTPEQLHWHGLHIPSDVDGAAEEGSPYIDPHGMRRIAFTPGPAGFRFYHTHLIARNNLNRGQYSGQVGAVYIEPKNEPGAYDREVFLVLKEFAPFFSRGGDMAMDFLAGARVKELEETGETAMKTSLAAGMPHGFEVGYNVFSINGRGLGHGEPIKVKRGERVLFHVLNGSATEIRSLALPGHSFPGGLNPDLGLPVAQIAAEEGGLGGPLTCPVIQEGTKGLLGLRKKSSNGDAELGPGFQYPDTRNPQRQVLPVGPVNELVEDWVVEYSPPVAVFCRLWFHTLITCIQPGL